MFCPECRGEYRQGFRVCSDCGVELVHSLPESGAPEPPPSPPVVGTDPATIYETGDPFRAELVCNFLETNGIDAVVFGPGDPRIAGYRIVVRRDDAHEARALVLAADRGEFAVSDTDIE